MTIPNFELRAPYAQQNVIIPDDWTEARLILTDYINRMAFAVNARELASYQEANLVSGVNISEQVNGQLWFSAGDANAFRYGLRTVVNVTAGLQDYSGGVTSQTVAHGITTTDETRFTRIYGVANDPGASSITAALPLPYVDVDAIANSIELRVDATNVTLRYGADYSAYTDVYIVLEYVEGT